MPVTVEVRALRSVAGESVDFRAVADAMMFFMIPEVVRFLSSDAAVGRVSEEDTVEAALRGLIGLPFGTVLLAGDTFAERVLDDAVDDVEEEEDGAASDDVAAVSRFFARRLMKLLIFSFASGFAKSRAVYD
jgi:TPP-dependent trihydroxycyclohexane-1,2-dione (THcHDO) dehydratase